MDLAIDSGSSHGSYVSHLMSRLALQRERMRVDCIDILSALMQHCPEELSFEAIEALQHARIFLHYPIRPSVMYELLDLTNTQYFKRTLELLLSEHAQTAERVLQIAPVLWYNALKHEDSAPVRVMAVATSRRFYIVERPTGIREPLFPEREYVYNKGEGIRLIEIREYRHLTRIVKGYPADNWLAAGWLHKENEGPNGETFDCLLMEVLSQTTDFIVCLRALSGRETEEERVDVLRDVVSAECLLQHIKLQIIQDSFLAIRRTSHWDLHEFFIDWKYWFAFDPTSAEEQWGVQLQCLQGETDELNWRLPQGGLTNFLGWVEEEEEEEEKEKETQENADKDNIKDFVKDKEEYTLKGIRLDAINQLGCQISSVVSAAERSADYLQLKKICLNQMKNINFKI
ncbi:Testis specific leucine rich repeat protein, related [Eimeria acervulina]|uniref:Testis specific leucine rich repeat protein, related n=1 Tax=Eimeria acervulina TaxID=5801 RepID=U6GCI8_EIMAC|nr:Testis specific leucine rich repeat protein, related [Eimeria acervulina]CDI77986.1 Testis specific leucine rich repeat protein, related [Eimeria acervulina]